MSLFKLLFTCIEGDTLLDNTLEDTANSEEMLDEDDVLNDVSIKD